MEHQAGDDIDWGPAGTEHFTGEVDFGAVHPPDTPEALAVLGVRFSPGARSDWHRHPAGQVLYVVEGTALVQDDAGSVAVAGPGDAVYAPPGEVHWHGAGPDEAMTHLSITDGGPTEWLGRKVTDEEYRSAR
ncbi:MAG: hypothetical protein A2Z12_08145 [Actinobacteria bacterium RBG_16_68_21]|nr:MAG: hypothetical protein A2Z12_08145 [Actinobacteria bacterium RBG_16_68_21]